MIQAHLALKPKLSLSHSLNPEQPGLDTVAKLTQTTKWFLAHAYHIIQKNIKINYAKKLVTIKNTLIVLCNPNCKVPENTTESRKITLVEVEVCVLF